MIRNKYELFEDYVILYAEKRNKEVFEILIDIDDLKIVDEWDSKVHVKYFKDNKSYYGEITKYLGTGHEKPNYKSVLLHRLIMNLEDPKIIVDHKNFNTLDNRKRNLSIISRVDNSTHRKGENSNNKTGYRNVCFYHGWYIVQLQINRKNVRLGKFKTSEEANGYAIKMRQKYYKNYDIL